MLHNYRAAISVQNGHFWRDNDNIVPSRSERKKKEKKLNVGEKYWMDWHLLVMLGYLDFTYWNYADFGTEFISNQRNLKPIRSVVCNTGKQNSMKKKITMANISSTPPIIGITPTWKVGTNINNRKKKEPIALFSEFLHGPREDFFSNIWNSFENYQATHTSQIVL